MIQSYDVLVRVSSADGAEVRVSTLKSPVFSRNIFVNSSSIGSSSTQRTENIALGIPGLHSCYRHYFRRRRDIHFASEQSPDVPVPGRR